MIQSVVALFLSKCSQLLVQFLHVLIQVPSFFDYTVERLRKMLFVRVSLHCVPKSPCILLFEGTNNPCFMLLKILCVVMLASQSLSSRCSSTWHPQREKPGSGSCRPSKVTRDVKDHVKQQMCLDESVSIAH